MLGSGGEKEGWVEDWLRFCSGSVEVKLCNGKEEFAEPSFLLLLNMTRCIQVKNGGLCLYNLNIIRQQEWTGCTYTLTVGGFCVGCRSGYRHSTNAFFEISSALWRHAPCQRLGKVFNLC